MYVTYPTGPTKCAQEPRKLKPPFFPFIKPARHTRKFGKKKYKNPFAFFVKFHIIKVIQKNGNPVEII